jgi:hypothetical protein
MWRNEKHGFRMSVKIAASVACFMFLACSAHAGTMNIEQAGSLPVQQATLQAPSTLKDAISDSTHSCVSLLHMQLLQQTIPLPFINDVRTDSHGNVISIAPHEVRPLHMPNAGFYLFLNPKGDVLSIRVDSATQENYKNYAGYADFAAMALADLKSCSAFHSLTAFDYRQWKRFYVAVSP